MAGMLSELAASMFQFFHNCSVLQRLSDRIKAEMVEKGDKRTVNFHEYLVPTTI